MNLFAESFKAFALAMDFVQAFDPKKFDNFKESIKRLGDVSIAELEYTFKDSGSKVRASLEYVINTIKKTINENTDAMTIKLSAKVSNSEGDEDLDSAGKALIAAFNSAIDEALIELKNKEVNFSSEGSHYVIELMNGFNSAKNLFIFTVKRVGEEAAKTISASSFFKVGQQCAVGLINGMNSKTNSIKAQCGNIGNDMLTALKKVLDIHSPSRKTYKIGEYFIEGGVDGVDENSYKLENAARNVGKKLCNISDDIKKQANKDFSEATAGMDFGTEVLRKYLNTYGEFSEDAKANAKMIGESKDLLINYAKQLYENSDQFDTDIEKLQSCRDKMAELNEQKKKLDAELASADSTKMASLASEQQSLNEQIISCNKELEEAMTTISDNIVDSFEKIRESIRDTAKEAMDFMSIDMTTGIDLLRDPEKTTSTVKDKKTGKEKEVEEVIETPVQVMEKELNKFKEFKNKIAELAEAGLTEGLLKQLEELGPSGVEKIDEFLKLTGEEISKANAYYQESLRLSADVFLYNYATAIQTQKDFAENMKKLVGMNFDKGIIEALAQAGAEGSATYMESFLSMTPEQVEEFNKKYAETLTLPDDIATDVQATLIKAGEEASNGFVNGVDSKIGEVIAEYRKIIIEPMAPIAQEGYDKMFDYGAYLDSGFLAGIRSKAGGILGGICDLVDNYVCKPTTDRLVIESPSKLFMKYGRYTVEGFAIGVNKYAYMAKDSVTSMSEGVKNNAVKVLSGIDEAMARKAEYSMRVKPVVNMDNSFKKMSSSLNVTPIVNDAQVRPINQTNAILKHVETAIAKNNADMSKNMMKLSQDMVNAMNEAYANREVSLYVDGRKMASTLAQPMSREFKVLSNRGL